MTVSLSEILNEEIANLLKRKIQHNLLRVVDDAIGVIKASIELWPTLVEICYFQKIRHGLPMLHLGRATR